jgi:hypothetical protein
MTTKSPGKTLDILNVTWFSGEATHFHLDGCFTKYNARLWASEDPRLF